jgi:alpha-glucosidase/alpha-D-xyloside xylohydrolase
MPEDLGMIRTTTKNRMRWTLSVAASLMLAGLSRTIPPAAVAEARPPQQLPIELAGTPVELTVTPVSEKTVRISLAPLDESAAAQPLKDEPVIVKRAWAAPALRQRFAGKPQTAQVGGLTVSVSASPLAFEIKRADGSVAQALSIDSLTGEVTFKIGDRPLFGLGEGGPQFDRRGRLDPMINSHDGYKKPTFGGRMPIPWLASPEGWALFFHEPLGSVDLRGSEGKFTPRKEAKAAPLDFFVVIGEPAALMTEYAGLTGFPTLPPLWTFGYQQSHRTVKDWNEVVWVAKTMREKKLPCDALIYLGTGFCPSGWNTGFDSFKFNPQVFANPEANINELKSLDYRVVLHMVFAPHDLYGTAYDAANAGDPKSAANYWARHRLISRMGIDGWWPDDGEYLNVEGRLARIRMYYEGPQMDQPNKRPYAFFRTGYAGLQRVGGWLWSGDVDAGWETLTDHVPVAVNTAMSGVPYWGTDIGGFFPMPELSSELYVRWFQFMSFCPLFRSHGLTWHLRLPFGWNTGELGPEENRGKTPVTTADLHHPEVEMICRKYLELRYRMMPYIYTLAREAHDTGLPMIRALWLAYADDPAATARGDEYLWGRELLVAPVTQKGAMAHTLYLPKGMWYDFWTEEKIEGGRELTRKVDLATEPLYVRAGAVLPLGPVKQATAEKSDGPLELVIYRGADGAASVYEDDGVSFDYEKGEWMRLLCAWNEARGELSLRLAPGSRMFPRLTRKINVRLAGGQTTKVVVFDGKPLVVKL